MRGIESADATSCDIYFRELTAESGSGSGNYDAVTDIMLFAMGKLEHANPGTIMERHILVFMAVLHDQVEHGYVPLMPGFYS